ncbi:MAG: hypothetical protein PHO54_05100, partial [Candidatus Peribacteraceae bacterium]|nr:hypothetical protein [Candidatus Peribacteraceae bacterium]
MAMLVLSLRSSVGLLVYDLLGATPPSVLLSMARSDATQYRVGLSFDERLAIIRFDVMIDMINKALEDPQLTGDEVTELTSGRDVLQDPQATADRIR